ncbi:MAG TPA: acyl-CoA dehydrogenase family protein [Spirochaetota bacterium]|nr:acyl-CoA dehydrogenase family protein [Spirochaetota bacterium]OPZ34771.1 MAG: Acyl-CoA dehydrogenase [Spirochaetes bacterium ADurb.BinA120]HNU91999.1 acyl-CoA dehydrogenase family protein [Spirochaetota bacterium]HPI14269.1 acyl-CoA dehydrogenase family protein [Spirochaetota bacterium]HPV97892.1 acyl-CoA dehydrogenase family protein [Spirochaetota bacterium]
MDFGFTEEQLMFRDTVYRFAKNNIVPMCKEADLKSEFSFDIWKKLGEMGLLGLPIPVEYGGQGADVVTCCLASEALGHAGVDQGHLLSFGAHTYLCADTIFKHGNESQKRAYVPRLASGEWTGCMGLTEPQAGSDAASVQTTAVKKGDRWILNGSKTFITNAPIADVCVVYTTIDRSKKHEGITAFIVEKGFKGFSTGKPFDKMGCRASMTSEVFFDDCEVPEENLLGSEGGGFLMTHQTLEWDRSALLAPYVGALMRMLELCTEYSITRKQFDKPIKDFQAIQHKLADMKIITEIMRLAIYRVAALKDAGHSINHLQASIAKAFAGDWGLKCASEAVQIFGGYGYIHEYPVEWFFRDAKIAQIGGGTSEIQRLIISRFI